MALIEKHFENPSQFFQYASWGLHDEHQGEYVFRGQGESKHKLVPSILRGSIQKTCAAYGISYSPEMDKLDLRDATDKAVYVANAVDCLVKKYTIHRQYAGKATPQIGQWQGVRHLHPDAAFLLAAKAQVQHDEIPTDLLDFSGSVDVALFFAARSVLLCNKPLKSGKLSVFAVGIDNLNEQAGLIIYRPDYWTNVNAAAQRGVMLLSNPEPYSRKLLPLCEQLSDFGARIIKMTLAHKHAKYILRILRDKGIDYSTMFPERTDAIGRAMLDRTLWQEP